MGVNQMTKKFLMIIAMWGVTWWGHTVQSADFVEMGDAGPLPGTAQDAGQADAIIGVNDGETDVDMYKLTLDTAGIWDFETTQGSDTILFLFNDQGLGIQMDDDSAVGELSLIQVDLLAGMYFLAIVDSNANVRALDSDGLEIWDSAFLSQAPPNGPGAENPVADWGTGGSPTANTYTISISHFVIPEPSTLTLVGLAMVSAMIRRTRWRTF